MHREVEVIDDGWGGEEVIVHEHIEHRGRSRSYSGSSSGSGSDSDRRHRRGNHNVKNNPGGVYAGGQPPMQQ